MCAIFLSLLSYCLSVYCCCFLLLFRVSGHFWNTFVGNDIKFILSHLCVKLNFMHSWYAPLKIICQMQMVLHLLHSYKACASRSLPHEHYLSTNTSNRTDQVLMCALNYVQHFDSIRFDSVLVTSTNETHIIAPIQLKWMDCYGMICVNPKTTINEMFVSFSAQHIVSVLLLLWWFFFLSVCNSMKLIYIFFFRCWVFF